MDNTIPPISKPNINNPMMDKVVSGEIENVPEPVKIVKPSESLLLNILMKTDALASSTLNATIKTVVNQQPIEVPVELKLDAKLDLPREVQNQVAVKVSALENGTLSFKLVSINNDKPGRFVTTNEPQPNLTNLQAGTSSAPKAALVAAPNQMVSQVKNEKPLIFDTSTTVKQAEVHPLELTSLISKIAQNSDLPKPLVDVIINNFKDVKVNVKLSQVIDAEIISNKQVYPNPQIAQLPNLNIPIQNSMERLQLILDNFSQEAKITPPSSENIQELVTQIKTEMMPFKNTLLAGEAVTLQDNQVAAVKTPIGNFLLETPLKISDASKFILEIKDINFPDKSPRFSLADLIPSQKLIDDLIDLRPLIGNMTADSVKQNHSALHKILELFQPLKDIGRQDLSAKIMAKMPSLNNDMLPNMVSFIKGSMNRDLSNWLGKEIIEDLTKSGNEGKEVISRLTNFMAANNREGVSWRMVEIPFFNGDNMSKIRIAIKKFTEEEEENTKIKKSKFGTRFVVDTSFTKLGNFQFDGFSLANDRRFDLVIRTSQVVDDDLCANILRIFKNTLNDVEYVGNVKINIKENFIKVCDDEHNEILKSGIYI